MAVKKCNNVARVTGVSILIYYSFASGSSNQNSESKLSF